MIDSNLITILTHSFQVRKFAYQLATHYGCKFPEQWEETGMTGEDWFSAFIKLNTCLSIRRSQATSFSRTSSFNQVNVEKFFDNISKVLEKHKFFFPQNIWNVDKTGIAIVQTLAKVVARCGERYGFLPQLSGTHWSQWLLRGM